MNTQKCVDQLIRWQPLNCRPTFKSLRIYSKQWFNDSIIHFSFEISGGIWILLNYSIHMCVMAWLKAYGYMPKQISFAYRPFHFYSKLMQFGYASVCVPEYKFLLLFDLFSLCVFCVYLSPYIYIFACVSVFWWTTNFVSDLNRSLVSRIINMFHSIWYTLSIAFFPMLLWSVECIFLSSILRCLLYYLVSNIRFKATITERRKGIILFNSFYAHF